ncbi:MAG: HAD family hydrolase [Acidimicrobiales bacterium]
MAATLETERRPAGAEATRLAVFDLDRTLVRGSSLGRLARSVAEAGLVSRGDLAGYLVREAIFATRGLGTASLDRLRRSLLEAVAGLDQEPLLDIVDRLAPTVAHDMYTGARWLLDRHLVDGHTVVVLSSSPHELVGAIAARIDPTIVAIGTSAEVVDGRYTGHLNGPFCHGIGKLERFRQEMGEADLTTAVAYADSASDIPLLRAFGTPVAVNPDRGLRTAAVTAGWPILEFS